MTSPATEQTSKTSPRRRPAAQDHSEGQRRAAVACIFHGRYRAIRPGIDYAAFARFLELAADVAQTRMPLPWPPGYIMRLEDMGYLVDLDTGEITRDPDQQPVKIEVA